MENLEPVRITLAEKLDAAAAAPLARDLLAVRGQAITLDASKVKKIGGRCLQVLISAHLTWRADMIPDRIDSPSATFREALRDFAASHILNVAP